MDCVESILSRRSIRKFKRKEVPVDILKKLVKYGGMAASGMNMQPIKYIIAASDKKVSEIFPYTKWAGYLKGKGAPSFEERPAAFILVFNDNNIRINGYELDAGAAVQNILLAAYAMGIGTCWLGAIDYEKISEISKIGNEFKLISAIAVGYPAQTSISEPAKDDIKYYLDGDEVIHVPKRGIDEIILNIF